MTQVTLTRILPVEHAEAARICSELWGEEGRARYDTVGQGEVADHQERVAALCLYIGGQIGSETLASQSARAGAVHDSGKVDCPQTSNTGEWTPNQRIAYRETHSKQGLHWLMTQTAHLGLEALDLGYMAFVHHRIPRSNRERLLQVADRTDALLTRQYVLDRYGRMSPDEIAEMVFAADPESQIHALPTEIVSGGRTYNLHGIVLDLARAAVSTLDS